MPCYDPVGTHRVDGTPTYRPCGNCIGCRLEYSRQWAVRMCHESSFYNENSFITLTYNQENLPEDGSLVKAHLQNFMKRLRRKNDTKKIRFYGCGEYGSDLGRPHYHLCLFGYNFPDREIFKGAQGTVWQNRWKKKGYDNTIYTSKMLDSLWKKGFQTIGDLTFESCAYVARYVTKKVNGEKKNNWYDGKQPEFALMSRMPGIGNEWIKRFKTDVYPKDFHTINGIKNRPNRYYDSICEKIDKKTFEEVKKKRRYKGENKKYESQVRLWQKERHRESITKTLERKIENG